MKQLIICLFVSMLVLSGCAHKTTSSTTPEPVAYPTQANVYYVRLEDGGTNGKLIWCNDSLVAVSTVLDKTFSSREEVLSYTYTLALGEKNITPDLESALWNDLEVTDVTVVDTHASIYLSGSLMLWWTCDNPRAREQLNSLAVQFGPIQSVTVYINDLPLEDYLSMQ